MTRRTYVDPAPARAHIQQHLAAGGTLRQLAQQATVHHTILSRLVTGKTHRVDIQAAYRIVTAPPPEPSPPRPTDVGCIRRLDALARMGWSVPAVAHRLGITAARLEHAQHRRHLPDPTARLLAATYPALVNTRGGDRWVSRCALRVGKLPPWAWELDSIDDPTVEPDVRYTRQGPEPPTLARALTERPLRSAAYLRATTGLEPLRDVA